MTLSELIAHLGEPTRSHVAGDPVSRRDQEGPTHTHTQWLLESENDGSRALQDQVVELIEFAERHRAALSHLRGRCQRIDISCAIFSEEDAQGGFELESGLLKRIADLDLDVTFDIY